jgi:hypothetical protein
MSKQFLIGLISILSCAYVLSISFFLFPLYYVLLSIGMIAIFLCFLALYFLKWDEKKYWYLRVLVIPLWIMLFDLYLVYTLTVLLKKEFPYPSGIAEVLAGILGHGLTSIFMGFYIVKCISISSPKSDAEQNS